MGLLKKKKASAIVIEAGAQSQSTSKGQGSGAAAAAVLSARARFGMPGSAPTGEQSSTEGDGTRTPAGDDESVGRASSSSKVEEGKSKWGRMKGVLKKAQSIAGMKNSSSEGTDGRKDSSSHLAPMPNRAAVQDKPAAPSDTVERKSTPQVTTEVAAPLRKQEEDDDEYEWIEVEPDPVEALMLAPGEKMRKKVKKKKPPPPSSAQNTTGLGASSEAEGLASPKAPPRLDVVAATEDSTSIHVPVTDPIPIERKKDEEDDDEYEWIEVEPDPVEALMLAPGEKMRKKVKKAKASPAADAPKTDPVAETNQPPRTEPVKDEAANPTEPQKDDHGKEKGDGSGNGNSHDDDDQYVWIEVDPDPVEALMMAPGEKVRKRVRKEDAPKPPSPEAETMSSKPPNGTKEGSTEKDGIPSNTNAAPLPADAALNTVGGAAQAPNTDEKIATVNAGMNESNEVSKGDCRSQSPKTSDDGSSDNDWDVSGPPRRRPAPEAPETSNVTSPPEEVAQTVVPPGGDPVTSSDDEKSVGGEPVAIAASGLPAELAKMVGEPVSTSAAPKDPSSDANAGIRALPMFVKDAPDDAEVPDYLQSALNVTHDGPQTVEQILGVSGSGDAADLTSGAESISLGTNEPPSNIFSSSTVHLSDRPSVAENSTTGQSKEESKPSGEGKLFGHRSLGLPSYMLGGDNDDMNVDAGTNYSHSLTFNSENDVKSLLGLSDFGATENKDISIVPPPAAQGYQPSDYADEKNPLKGGDGIDDDDCDNDSAILKPPKKGLKKKVPKADTGAGVGLAPTKSSHSPKSPKTPKATTKKSQVLFSGLDHEDDPNDSGKLASRKDSFVGTGWERDELDYASEEENEPPQSTIRHEKTSFSHVENEDLIVKPRIKVVTHAVQTYLSEDSDSDNDSFVTATSQPSTKGYMKQISAVISKDIKVANIDIALEENLQRALDRRETETIEKIVTKWPDRLQRSTVRKNALSYLLRVRCQRALEEHNAVSLRQVVDQAGLELGEEITWLRSAREELENIETTEHMLQRAMACNLYSKVVEILPAAVEVLGVDNPHVNAAATWLSARQSEMKLGGNTPGAEGSPPSLEKQMMSVQVRKLQKTPTMVQKSPQKPVNVDVAREIRDPDAKVLVDRAGRRIHPPRGIYSDFARAAPANTPWHMFPSLLCSQLGVASLDELVQFNGSIVCLAARAFETCQARPKLSEYSFPDSEFPANHHAIVSRRKPSQHRLSGRVVSWRRVTAICKKSKLFEDGLGGVITSRNPFNPQFLTCLGVLSRRPDILASIFSQTQLQSSGMVSVRLFRNGSSCWITVDDQIPCSSGGQPGFARTSLHSECWATILEKAYAKSIGSYEALARVSVEDALCELTGCAVEAMEPTEEGRCSAWVNEFGSDDWIDRFVSWHQKGHIVTMRGSQQLMQIAGLEGHKAFPEMYFQVVDVVNHKAWFAPCWDLIEESVRSDCRCEQKEYAVDDAQNTPAQVVARRLRSVGVSVKNPPRPSCGIGHGMFCMDIRDFQWAFDRVIICRFVPDSWYCRSFEGLMSTEQGATHGSGGSLENSSWRKNPQFFFSTKKSCLLSVSLRQKVRASKGLEAFGFVVYKNADREGRVSLEQEDIVASTGFSSSPNISLEAFFDRGGSPFGVIVFTKARDARLHYTLCVSSPESDMCPVPCLLSPWTTTQASGEWNELNSGGCHKMSTWRQNPQFLLYVKEGSPISAEIEVFASDTKKNPHGFYVLKAPSSSTIPPFYVDSECLVGKTNFSSQKRASLSCTLNPNDTKIYYIVPTMLQPGRTGTYDIVVHASGGVILKAVKGGWESCSVSDEWKYPRNGGCLANPTWRSNPRYVVSPARLPEKRKSDASRLPSRKIVLLLHAVDQSGKEIQEGPAVGMHVFRRTYGDIEWLTGSSSGSLVASSKEFSPWGATSLVVDESWEAGDDMLVIPCTLEPGVSMSYTLTILRRTDDFPVQVRALQERIEMHEFSGEWTSSTAGGCYPNFATWVNNPVFSLSSCPNRSIQRVIIMRQHMELSEAPRAIGFHVYDDEKSDGKPSTDPSRTVAMSSVMKAAEVSCFVPMPQASRGLGVVPYTFLPSVLGSFSITIYQREFKHSREPRAHTTAVNLEEKNAPASKGEKPQEVIDAGRRWRETYHRVITASNVVSSLNEKKYGRVSDHVDIPEEPQPSTQKRRKQHAVIKDFVTIDTPPRNLEKRILKRALTSNTKPAADKQNDGAEELVAAVSDPLVSIDSRGIYQSPKGESLRRETFGGMQEGIMRKLNAVVLIQAVARGFLVRARARRMRRAVDKEIQSFVLGKTADADSDVSSYSSALTIQSTLFIQGTFSKGNSGGPYPYFPSWRMNPQYLLRVKADTKMNVSLRCLAPGLTIGLGVVAIPRKSLNGDAFTRLMTLPPGSNIHLTSFKRNHSFKFAVKSSMYYYLIPWTAKPGQIADFTLSVELDSESGSRLTPLSSNWWARGTTYSHEGTDTMRRKMAMCQAGYWDDDLGCGGGPRYETFTENPSLSFESSKRAEYVFIISQFVERVNPTLLPIGLVLVNDAKQEIMSVSKFEKSPDVSIRMTLPASRGTPYSIIPCTKEPGMHGKFVVSVFSSDPKAMKILD